MRAGTPIVLWSLACASLSCHSQESAAPKSADVVATPAPPPAPPPPAHAPSAPAPLEGEALAQRYIGCWVALSAADWDAFGNCYADDAVSQWPDSGQPDAKGPEAIIEGSAKPYKEAFSDAKAVPQLVLVNGRRVASIVWISGTHSDALKGAGSEIPATRKPLSELAFHAVTFDDKNEVTQEVFVEDFGSLLYQLGLSAGPARAAREGGLQGAPIVVVASGDAAEAANVEAVQRAHELFAKEDLKATGTTLADDVLESDQSAPADVKGKKRVLAGNKVFLGAMGKVGYDCPGSWAAGPYVVAQCKFSAVNDGNLGKLKKTGKPVALTVVEVRKLEGGKFTEIWRFFNSAAFTSQLGLGLARPSSSKPESTKPESTKASKKQGAASP